ncbi:hypothetical protein FQA39_LY10528 [Lamprigera yunnana]|nr:hypothetical protein FQA39_LY10528 [Lamprigera yunnana]
MKRFSNDFDVDILRNRVDVVNFERNYGILVMWSCRAEKATGGTASRLLLDWGDLENQLRFAPRPAGEDAPCQRGNRNQRGLQRLGELNLACVGNIVDLVNLE